MSRTSPVHYIAPSAISITPNANGSVNDLAVYVARSAKIRVYSPRAGIGYDGNAEYKQWTLTGRNRRLTASQTPYTIYARISKTDTDDGYVVFAQKVQDGDVWKDKYPYVTTDGLASGTAGRDTGNYWYIRIGDVSIPSEGARTVTLDTGILGTDQFNTDWAMDPDAFPLRVEIGCVIDDEDVGQNAYVYWDQVLVMTASLVEGWTGTDAQRFRHWSITRNTGNSDTDAAWLLKDYVRAFKTTGSIRLSHIRGSFDDFGGAVSTMFTVTAWGVPEGQDDADESEYVVLAELPVSILAETAEKYELVLTPNIIGYNPTTEEYSPAGGCVVSLRATDQRSDVFDVTFAQFRGAQLAVSYAEVGSSTWVPLTFSGSDDMPAQAVIPVSAFAAQKSLNVRLVNAAGKELDSDTVAFVRDGEDSRDREWIFLRSQEPITFGDASSEHPAPSYIQSGEVNPSGAAGTVTEDKNQEGWVPEGWWDEQQGTDADIPYEYGSYRNYVRATDEEDGHWGDFSMPRIWTHYGEDGILYSILTDADSVSIPTDQASVTTGFNAVFQRKAGDNTPAAYQCYYAAYRRHGNTYSRFEHSGLTRVSSVVFGNIAVSSDSTSQNYCEAIVIYISDCPLSAGALQSAPPDSYLAKKEISVIKDGNTGPSGEDAYGVYVNPGYAIFEETLNSGIPVVDTSGWVGVIQVLKGSAPQPFKLTYGQHSHCRPTSDSTQEDTSVMEATVKFDLLKTQGAYSSEGYLAISVATDDGAYTNTNVKIPYYLSLLDTLKKAAANWFLSKEYDDTAKGNINFEKDVAAGGDFSVAGDAAIDGILMALEQIFTNRIQSDNFNGDGPFDTGFELTKSDGNGYSYLVVDKLFVRLKAIFNELEIRKISYSGGNFIFSHAGSHIVYVKELQLGVESEVEGTVLKLSGAVDVADNVLNVGSGSVSGSTLTLSSDKRVYAYRCYIMKDDGTTATENWWRVDDQARCQTFNVVEPGHYDNVENTSYWRRVIAVGHEKVRLNDSEQEQEYDYVDLSLIDCMQGSDIPKAGDQIVQMGNRTDAERQGFISLEVAGEYAPAFKVYKNVNGYTLDGKRKICISPKLTDIRAQKFIIETEYDTRQMTMERGDWSRIPEHKCYYYNLVQHNGATWLCVCPEGEYTTEEPSETATYWRPYAQKGKDGKDGKSFNILDSYDTVEQLIAAHPTGSVGDAYMVAGDLYVWDEVNTRWHNSGRIQGDAGRGIASAEIVYGVSENPATLPTEWEASPAELTIGPGDYLFVRTTLRYDDGTDAAPYYSISRFGVDGSFKQTAFTRTNKNISSQQLSGKPLPNDFVFDGETIHFSDGIPSGEKRVWATSNIFYGDGTQSGWTALTPMTDTSTFDVEFSPNETKPANPSDDESQREAQGWYDPTRNPSHDFSTTIWRAERQKKNGEWGAWAIEKVKGEKGDSVAYDEEHSSIGYAYSSMGTPESGRDYPSDITSWSSTPPAVQKGKYLWTKDVTAYDNAGTIVYTTTYGVQYQPNDGESVEIDSSRTFIKYCRQTKSQYTGQHPADSEFSLTYPTNLGQGDYLWILNQVAYVGVANPLKSYSVSMLGTDGGKGDPGADGYTTHFAYAASADGSQNFSTTNFNGATYIGTYRDQKADDSTDYRHYVWTAWKGDNGRGITSVNKYFKADTATTPATPSGAPSGTGWSDDGNSLIIPANADKHLYESTCTAYSDGTYSWTTPIDDGLISDMASTAEEFALSDSNTAAPTSGWASSVSPVAGKWIWSRTVLTFKSGNPTYINTQCVGYCGTNGRDGADSVTTALSTQTVEIPTDTDGVCLEDTQVELSARLFVRSKEVKVTDIVVDEQSSQRVTSVVKSTLDMMPWATSADASVQGNVITFSRNASVQGAVLTIGGDAFNVTPSKVVVTIAKGTVVDEHTVTLRVTGVDKDKTTHYGFAAFNVQRHYIPVDGQDAINIIVTPASLIVNQSLQDPSNLGSLSEEIIFSGTVGESQVAVTKVEITNTEHCTVSGSNSNKATLTAIEADSNGHYYDQASFICKVTTEYGVIEGIKARVYANLLGTWKETVEADTKSAIAESTWFDLDEHGNIVESQRLGNFVQSSKENTAKLEELNYIAISHGTTNQFTLTADHITQYGSTYRLVMDYQCSFETVTITIRKGAETIAVFTNVMSYDTFDEELTELTAGTYAIAFDKTVTLDRVDLFAVGADKFSEISQTVDNINLEIRNGLESTGIDIENGLITLDAGTVQIKNGDSTAALFTNGKIKADYIDAVNIVSIALTSQTITAVDATIKNITIEGSSVFRGTIYAVDGEFTGTITAKQGGNIGGFKVDYNLSLYAFSDGLDAGSRHNGHVDSLTIKPSGVTLTRGRYDNSTTISALQSSIIIGPAAELSGDYHGNVRIVNRHSDTSWPLLVNFGIYLDVQGARNWDDDPTYGNHALLIAKGNIAGFRKETRRVGSSQTLSIYDNNVICTKENITLTLPNAPEDGQEYTIIPYGRVYVAASGSDKIRYPNGASYTTATFDDYKHHWLIYDSVNKLWLADWGG